MIQETKVLNILNWDADVASAIINEQLVKGWKLFAVLPLGQKPIKHRFEGRKSRGYGFMVVLMRNRKVQEVKQTK